MLSRIQENRRRVILPSIDNIKQDNFEVQRYENSAHGYSWELWCMYISPPKDWWDAGDPSLPIRYGTEPGATRFLSLSCKVQKDKAQKPARRGWLQCFNRSIGTV